MQTNKNNTILRFAGIFTLVFAMFMIVLVQIIYIQTKERKQWLELAEKQDAVRKTVTPMRGNIYDCNGKLLTGSLPRYDLVMDTRVDALHQGGDTLFKNNLDSIADGLSRILGGRSKEGYKRMLNDGFNHKNGRLYLNSKPATYSQMKEVLTLPLFRKKNKYKSGLLIEPRNVRVKPYGSLASRTLGNIYGEGGEGNSGLEKQYDQLLRGKPGESQRMKVNGVYEDVIIVEPESGYDLITTIDANLQDIVEMYLRQRLELRSAAWGCCILMETHSGEIKAICNLDRNDDGGYTEMMNHAVQRVEPGSTFKTVSLMAALDDGKMKLTDTLYTFGGNWTYNGVSHHTDAHKMDAYLTLQEGLAVSSNVVFARLITQSYGTSEKFVHKLQKMGLCDSVPCEIPGAQQPLIQAFNDKTTISKMSYGYSVELTPWETLMFYNGIANGGKMIAPFLVKEIRKDGETEKIFNAKTINSSLCSSRALEDVKKALHDVVWSELGTASVYGNIRKAQSDLVHIAGKTGTAQVRKNGAYQSGEHRIAFVGYFPEENPQYTCICVIGSPQRPYDAGLDCGITVRYIAEKTMAYAWTKNARDLAMPYDSIRKPGVKGGMQEHIKHAAKGSGIKVTKTDSQWAKVNHELHAISVEVAPTSIPNVIGMGARDAVYAIEQTGMHAAIRGKGKVVTQSVEPGSAISKGGTVYLELR